LLTINFDKLDIKEGDRILDIGCGEGRHIHRAYMCDNVLAVGIDIKLDDIDKTQKMFRVLEHDNPDNKSKWGVTTGNALFLPFADNTFDHIICSEVLEHIPDYENALAEIDRILKPNGYLTISVPRSWPEKICWALSESYHNEKGGHVHIYNAKKLCNKIKLKNMNLWATHGAHALHSPFWWLKCLMWENRDSSRIIDIYHRFLVWDIMKQPWLTRTLDKILNPIMGKSVVFYFTKGIN